MGTSAHKVDIRRLPGNLPQQCEYNLVSAGPNYYIWGNRIKNLQQLIQYPFTKQSDDQLHQHIETYIWQHNNPVLVSAMFFRCEESANKYSIFYERVLTNLSRIKDLCFQDCLEFYYVALRGFKLLWEKFGVFQVREDMFHVTMAGKIKVWCDRNISRLYPSSNPSSASASQQQMILQIVRIIDTNTDYTNSPLSGSGSQIGNTTATGTPKGISTVTGKGRVRMNTPITQKIGTILIQDAAVSSFDMAINRFVQICEANNFVITGQLQCLETIKKGGVLKLVDEYGHGAKLEPANVEKGNEVKTSQIEKDTSMENSYTKNDGMRSQNMLKMKQIQIKAMKLPSQSQSVQKKRPNSTQDHSKQIKPFSMKQILPTFRQSPSMLPSPTSARRPVPAAGSLAPHKQMFMHTSIPLQEQSIVQQAILQRPVIGGNIREERRSYSAEHHILKNGALVNKSNTKPVVKFNNLTINTNIPSNNSMFTSIPMSNALRTYSPPNREQYSSLNFFRKQPAYKKQELGQDINKSIRQQVDHKIKQQSQVSNIGKQSPSPNLNLIDNTINSLNSYTKVGNNHAFNFPANSTLSSPLMNPNMHANLYSNTSFNQNQNPQANKFNSNVVLTESKIIQKENSFGYQRPFNNTNTTNGYFKAQTNNTNTSLDNIANFQNKSENKNNDVVAWDSSMNNDHNTHGLPNYSSKVDSYSIQANKNTKAQIGSQNPMMSPHSQQSSNTPTSPYENTSYESLLQKLKAKYSSLTYNNDKVPYFTSSQSPASVSANQKYESKNNSNSGRSTPYAQVSGQENRATVSKFVFNGGKKESLLDRILEGESRHEDEFNYTGSTDSKLNTNSKDNAYQIKISTPTTTQKTQLQQKEPNIYSSKKYDRKIDDDIWKDMQTLQKEKNK